MAAERATLRGISEIRAYFRTNPTPVYFVSPTPFNLLGIDRWLRNFFLTSPTTTRSRAPIRGVFAPQDRPHTEFESMEEICTYLLRDPEVLQRIRRGGPGGKAVFVMFDAETERRRRGRGLERRPSLGRAAPPARLEDRDDAAGGRGRRAERAEHAGPRPDLRGAGRARRSGRARGRPRGADALRRLRQDDLLHPLGARLGPPRVAHGRRGAQGHEASRTSARPRSRRPLPATAPSSGRS